MKRFADTEYRHRLMVSAIALCLCVNANASDLRDAQFFDSTDTAPIEAPQPSLVIEETTLVIGGQLYLQSDAMFNDATTLGQSPLSQQALLYMYADQRPSSQTRVFIKGSLLHPLSTPTDSLNAQLPAFAREPARIEELWLKMNLDQRVFLTLGMQPIRWGVSRIWNPTDFLNERQKDPLAIFDDRPGLACAKLHLPVEATGTNLYVLLRPGLSNQIDALQYAARVEQIWGVSEWSLSTDISNESPIKLGGDISIGVGQLDLKGEVATRSTAPNRRWTGAFNLDEGSLPTQTTATHWPVQWTLGVEWSLNYDEKRSLFITLEYFHNPLGYRDDAQLYPWLIAQGDYTPLYVGQSYLGANLALPGLGSQQDHTVLLSGIANLSDATSILRLDYQVTVLTRVRLSAYAATYLGDLGEFHYPYEIPAGVAGDTAISITPPSLSAGLWTAVAF